MRDEVQTFIGRDDTTGEDMEVRRVAVNALGYHAGTVVVMDPISGKVYSIVNQEWALRRGFKPCSTIKLVTGVAGLEEKMISPFESTNISDRYRIDLTDALAYSNNTYFQHIGGQVGFDKMMGYAKEMGLGEKTGVNVPYEYSGKLPAEKTGFALNRMSSHGDDFEVTALQLGTLVSSMANGGKILVPYIPRKRPRMRKRKFDVTSTSVRTTCAAWFRAWSAPSIMVPARKPTIRCRPLPAKPEHASARERGLGLFTSYAPLANPRLAVVVITRGPDARKHFPAAVAGRIYRDLGSRFGTPINLQMATGSRANDAKAAELNEEEKDAEEAEIAETEAAITEEEAKGGCNCRDYAAANSASARQSNPAAAIVKRVLMPVEPRSTPDSEGGVTKVARRRLPLSLRHSLMTDRVERPSTALNARDLQSLENQSAPETRKLKTSPGADAF